MKTTSSSRARRRLLAAGGLALAGLARTGTAASQTAPPERAWLPLVNARDHGAKGDGVTDDTAAIQSALDTGRSIYLPPGDYRISSTLRLVSHSQRIVGSGMAASFVAGSATSQLRATANIEYLRVSGRYVVIENLLLETPTVPHTRPHIRFVNGADSGEVRHCRINGAGTDGGNGPGITFDNGAGGPGSSVIGLVRETFVVHASITVRIPDVKVQASYCWALSKQWGIGVFDGASNFVASDVDFVPPLRSTPGAKAGLYVSGPCANPSAVNCYFDGNFSLDTGKGAVFENGCLGPSVIGGKANGCDDDVLTFDSVIAPTCHATSFFNNNQQGRAASDIVLRSSFGQPLEKPVIGGTSHIQSASRPGLPGAAVKVAAGCARKGIRITNVSIHQPASGGYADPGILLEDGPFFSDMEGTLRGCNASRHAYAVSVSADIPAGATSMTLRWPHALAYPPRMDQIRLTVSGIPGNIAVPVGIKAVSTTQIQIAITPSTTPVIGRVHAAAEL